MVKNYFPEQETFTVLVDSSVLIYAWWRETAEKVWHAPKEISDKLVSDNLTLDGLRALSQKYPGRARILFDCSIRDGALANHQSYLRKKEKTWTDEDGDYIESVIRNMATELLKLPDTGVFLWDGIPYGSQNKTYTLHTILPSDEFTQAHIDGVTIAKWAMDAVNGNIKSYGLDLLNGRK